MIRTILNINWENNSLVPGVRYHFGFKIIASATHFKKVLRIQNGKKWPELALLVSCIGRRLVLSQWAEEEIDEVIKVIAKALEELNLKNFFNLFNESYSNSEEQLNMQQCGSRVIWDGLYNAEQKLRKVVMYQNSISLLRSRPQTLKNLIKRTENSRIMSFQNIFIRNINNFKNFKYNFEAEKNWMSWLKEFLNILLLKWQIMARTRYLVHEIVELLVISDGNKVEISEELPPVEVDKFRIP